MPGGFFQHLLFVVIYTMGRRAEMSFKRSHRRHKSLLTRKELPRSCYRQKNGVKRPNVIANKSSTTTFFELVTQTIFTNITIGGVKKNELSSRCFEKKKS